MNKETCNIFSIDLGFWGKILSIISNFRNEDEAVFCIKENGAATLTKSVEDEQHYETVVYLQLLKKEDRAGLSDGQIDAMNLLLVYNFCIRHINEFEQRHPELERN